MASIIELYLDMGRQRDRTRRQILLPGMTEVSLLAEISTSNERRVVRAMPLIHDQLLKIWSIRNREAYCRTLQRYNLQVGNEGLNLSVDFASGLVRCRANVYLQSGGVESSVDKILRSAAVVTSSHLLFHLQYVNQLPNGLLSSRDARHLQRTEVENTRVNELREIMALSHLTFDSKTGGISEEQLLPFLRDRLNSLPFRQERTLFNAFNEAAPILVTEQILNGKLKARFMGQSGRLAPRKLPNGQNLYLFNTILIKNEEKLQLRPSPFSGNNSLLKLADVEIAYIDSENPVVQGRARSQLKKELKLEEREVKPVYIVKTIAIKLPLQGCGKVAHEKQVVQHFRTACSPYFIKYYHSIQGRFPYRQHLLMDCFPDALPLSLFIQKYAQALFLSSKMHLFIHLTGALLFLQELNIVHMDLSPNNILVTKDLIPKIIDFGEAYHPRICDENPNYRPGFTLPFAPPETFSTVKKFTSKSDVFSFGVNLYRLLMTRDLLKGSCLAERYLNRSYLDYALLAPEGGEQVGNARVVNLLLLLASRCMSESGCLRPGAFWLQVILNTILQLFK